MADNEEIIAPSSPSVSDVASAKSGKSQPNTPTKKAKAPRVKEPKTKGVGKGVGKRRKGADACEDQELDTSVSPSHTDDGEALSSPSQRSDTLSAKHKAARSRLTRSTGKIKKGSVSAQHTDSECSERGVLSPLAKSVSVRGDDQSSPEPGFSPTRVKRTTPERMAGLAEAPLVIEVDPAEALPLEESTIDGSELDAVAESAPERRQSINYLKGRITMYEAEIQRQNQLISYLMKTDDDAGAIQDKLCRDAESRVTTLTREMSAHKKTIARLAAENKDLVQRLSVASTPTAQAADFVLPPTPGVPDAREQPEQLEQLEAVRAELAEAQAEVARLRQTNDNLLTITSNAAVSMADGLDRKELAEEVAALRSAKEALGAEVSALRAALQEQAARASESAGAPEVDLDVAASKLSTSMVPTQEYNSLLEKLSELEALQARNCELEGRCGNLENDNARLLVDVRCLAAEVQRLSEELAAYDRSQVRGQIVDLAASYSTVHSAAPSTAPSTAHATPAASHASLEPRASQAVSSAGPLCSEDIAGPLADELNEMRARLSLRPAGADTAAAQAQAQAQIAAKDAQILQLTAELAAMHDNRAGLAQYESKCFIYESRITELEVLLTESERQARLYRDSAERLEQADATLAKYERLQEEHGVLVLAAARTEDRLRAAEELSGRAAAQNKRLAELKTRQDARIRELLEARRAYDAVRDKLDPLRAENAKLREKELNYSTILSTLHTSTQRNEARVRDLELRYRVDVGLRDEQISALAREKDVLAAEVAGTRTALRDADDLARRMAARAQALEKASESIARQAGGSKEDIYRTLDIEEMDYSVLERQGRSASRSASRAAALRATSQLRAASRSLRNLMD